MLATNESRTLPARPEALEALHEMLDRFWSAVESARGGPVSPNPRHGLAIAAAEVAANIIRYAQADSFEFSLTLHGNTVEARFIDAGVPFLGVADGHLDPELLAEGGMGLALAKRGLDSFGYQRLANQTNCWTLVLLLPVPT
ncbi:MAG: ATP-binding protein [Pseudomonadota bacterium]|nr:ATP-binding protein [Pseudomonadota bacterium]